MRTCRPVAISAAGLVSPSVGGGPSQPLDGTHPIRRGRPQSPSISISGELHLRAQPGLHTLVELRPLNADASQFMTHGDGPHHLPDQAAGSTGPAVDQLELPPPPDLHRIEADDAHPALADVVNCGP